MKKPTSIEDIHILKNQLKRLVEWCIDTQDVLDDVEKSFYPLYDGNFVCECGNVFTPKRMGRGTKMCETCVQKSYEDRKKRHLKELKNNK